MRGKTVVARIEQNVVYRSLAEDSANMVSVGLCANDISKLQKAISEYMDKSISFYDAGAEGFYYGTEMEKWLEKRYDVEMKEDGIENFIKLGIAFSAKNVVISARR